MPSHKFGIKSANILIALHMHLLRIYLTLSVVIAISCKQMATRNSSKIDKTFKRLEALHDGSIITRLPTKEEVKSLEEKYKISFPPSYRRFLLEKSYISGPVFDPLSITHPDFSNSLMTMELKRAKENGLPEYLFPVVESNGDYYCLDLNSEGPEYDVVLWSLSSMWKEQRFKSFRHWLEYWIDKATD